MADNYLCSNCISYSQASISHYTQRFILLNMNLPLQVSVTILETTAPVKLAILNGQKLKLI